MSEEAVVDEVMDDAIEAVPDNEAEEIKESAAEGVTETVDPLEAIAREGGWAPIDDWRGDKDKWKDAETFIREGIKIQGKQHDKIDRLTESVKTVESTMKKMAASEVQRTRKQLEAQAARLEEERQEAFRTQDADQFESVDRELRETNDALGDIDDQRAAAEEFEKTFSERNSWYKEDKAMTAYALQSAQHLKAAFPDLDEGSYMDELERTVKAQFPNEFQNPNRRAGSMAGGDKPAAQEPVGGSKKKSFSTLPKEAQEAFAELNMYMPAGSKMTKADYVKSYYEEIA